MKSICLIASMIFVFSGYAQQTPFTGVEKVDLQKYSGKWYTVASYQAHSQNKCFCSMSDYRLTGKGKMRIINSCRKGSVNGKIKTAKGMASPVKGSNNTKLKVKFCWFLKANYWIVALDENYQWAVVSEPKHKDFWILSRIPVMGNDEFQHVLEIVKNNGFDLQKVEIVPQSCR